MEGFALMIIIFVGLALILIVFVIKKICKVLKKNNQSKSTSFNKSTRISNKEFKLKKCISFEDIHIKKKETPINSESKEMNDSRTISIKPKRILNKLIEKFNRKSLIPNTIEITEENNSKPTSVTNSNIVCIKTTNEEEIVTNDM